MWAVISKTQYNLILADRQLPEGLQVFRWAKDIDFEPVSRTCEEQLERTESLLHSTDFSSKIDGLVSMTKQKLAPG